MSARSLGAILVLAVLGPHAATAQSDKAAVLSVVKKVFEGMKARDTALMRAQMDPAARLIGVDPTKGVQAIDPSRWIGGIGKSSGDVYDERIFDPEVRVDEDLATVWTYYEFWRGSKLSHCGYDAFMLSKVGGAWKIVQVADTRKQSCTPRK
ncbi:MAG: nuclear transport factor 2 family protein [Gemmatimonadota bacterium]